VRLSETDPARIWLEQFETSDVPIAKRLLDDLTVVTPTVFTTRMRKLVSDVIRADRRAVALYPVWEVVEPKLSILPKESDPGESVFPVDGPHEKATREKGKDGKRNFRRRTIPDPQLGISGSVGSMIHLIGDLRKQFGTARLFDRPALSTLRATKCRKIVLLDDFVGSGQRLVSYLEAFYQHKTIKSWFSYPGLSFTIICYAASQDGLRRLRDYQPRWGHTRPHPVEVIYDQFLHRGRSFWSDTEREEIENLCRKYAPLTGHQRIPIGYKDAFSMIVFPYAIPNTAPAILWSSVPGRWNALFPNRVVSEQLLCRFDQVQRDPAGELLPETLQRIGQMRLAKLDWRRHATPEYRELILLLATRALGFRKIERIAETMDISQERCIQLTKSGRRFDLIRADGGLTARGLQELDYARSVGAIPWEPPELREERLYFPMSLRSAGQSSI
jgi:hypothetical protein